MSVQDLLNTDVETIGARALEAVRWWLAEMRGVFGPLLIDRKRTPQIFAEQRPDGRFVLRDAAGLSVPGEARTHPVSLVLGPEDALVRLTPAPRVPERDIVRTVRLDLDRLTPFPPETAYQHISVVKSGGEGRPQVLIAATPRARADAVLAAARQAGLLAAALVAEGPDGALIDFLPAMQAKEGRGGRARWVWAVVALLVVANVGVAVWRDSHDLATLQDAVSAQQPTVERIRAMRQRAQDDRNDVIDRLNARAKGEPLRVLDALSRALSHDVEIKRLTFDGATIHLTGTRRNSVDVLEALKAEPLFVNVRNANPDRLADDGVLDVLADVRAAPVGHS